MALSDKSKEILVVAMANRVAANEISAAIDAGILHSDVANAAAIALIQADVAAIKASLNALLVELEARRDATETIADVADGFFEGLIVA